MYLAITLHIYKYQHKPCGCKEHGQQHQQAMKLK